MRREAWRRLWRDQGGFTVLELQVAAVLGIIMIGAAVQSYVSSLNSANLSVNRADSNQEVLPGMERMTRDIRSATRVVITGGNRIDLQTPERNGSTASATKRVYYDCSAGKCTRDEGPGDSGSGTYDGALSGSPKTVIDRVQNTDVFTPTSATFTGGTVTSSPYVTIKVTVELSGPSARSARTVQYNDGITLRNVPTS